MSKKITRRRWRRPQRLTLDGPAPSRRKDLVVPDELPLAKDEAWGENRKRMALLLSVYAAAVVAEGVVVGLLVGMVWLVLPLILLLGFGYLVAGARFGDDWMRTALAASPDPPPHARNLLDGVVATAGIPRPELHVGPGDAPNAIALGLRRRWILVTPGATRLPRLELESMLAHELAHLRDGDAALASAFVLLAGAPDLTPRAIHAPGGFLAFLSVPLWPACLLVRVLAGALFPADREHRCDVVGALLVRYPPGMRGALESAKVEQGTSRLPATDRFWFAPRTPTSGPSVPERAARVAEM